MEISRICLVCRQKALKRDLCRFVRSADGEILFDEKGLLPHRGAWICAHRSCLVKAFRKRLLFKGERTLIVNDDAMLKGMFDQMKKGILSCFGLLKRTQKIEIGREAVKRSMSNGKAHAVVCARDLSVRSLNEMKSDAIAIKSVPILESPLLMDEMGLSLGRKKTGVVALLESRITIEILSRLDKLKRLEC